MKQFAIRDLERFSGIKAHTIRTWELRYGIPRPVRNLDNSRRYDLDDLRSILNLALLNRQGYKISLLSALHPQQLADLIRALNQQDASIDIALNEIIINTFDLDLEATEAVLDRCFLQWPAERVFSGVILPFLKKTRLLWQGSKLTEEHLVVTALRKKIMWGIEKVATPLRNGRPVVLFLPDTKQLDLGLLYMHLHLRLHGVQVIYLGNDVSIENLHTIFSRSKPGYAYTYLSRHSRFDIEALAFLFEQEFEGVTLAITASDGMTHLQHANITYLDFDEAARFLVA